MSGSEIDLNERNEDPSLKRLSGARSRKGGKNDEIGFRGPTSPKVSDISRLNLVLARENSSVVGYFLLTSGQNLCQNFKICSSRKR